MDIVHHMHSMESNHSSVDASNASAMITHPMMHMGGNHSNTGLPHGIDHTNTDMHNMGNHADNQHSGGGHALYFSFELPIQVLFFEWNIVSQGQLAASCIGVFLLAILYEGLKVWRQHLLYQKKCRFYAARINNISKEIELDSERIERPTLSRIFNGWHILQSVLQVIQTTLGMLLMLIYMTFNVWLAIAVSLGSGIGYFFFAWTMEKDLNVEFGDHCQ